MHKQQYPVLLYLSDSLFLLVNLTRNTNNIFTCLPLKVLTDFGGEKLNS